MAEPRVKNASDEQQVKKADKASRLRELMEKDDLAFVLSKREGRRYMWKLLSLCGVFAECMSSDANWTAFNLGRRAVGTTIYKEIMELDPAIISVMGIEERQETEMSNG